MSGMFNSKSELVGSERGEPRSAVRNGPPQKALPIEIPAMSLDELNRLTDNFGPKSLIGEGSYGRVFYAKLKDGTPAAVKKLDTSSSSEPDPDFTGQVIKHLISVFVSFEGLFLSSGN